jgi:hypothetical protein
MYNQETLATFGTKDAYYTEYIPGHVFSVQLGEFISICFKIRFFEI